MDSDSPEKQAARVAWLELLMFLKVVLRQFGRGKRPHQSLHFFRALLNRWKLGERASLWNEALQANRRAQPQTTSAGPKPEQTHREILNVWSYWAVLVRLFNVFCQQDSRTTPQRYSSNARLGVSR